MADVMYTDTDVAQPPAHQSAVRTGLRILAVLLALLQACIWLLAATNKATSFQTFTDSVRSHGLIPIPEVAWLSCILIALEAAIGLALLVGVIEGRVAVVPLALSVLLLIGFLVYAAAMTARPEGKPCGCGLGASLTWTGVLLRDCVFAALAIATLVVAMFVKRQQPRTTSQSSVHLDRSL